MSDIQLRKALEELATGWENDARYLSEHAEEYADEQRTKGGAEALEDAAEELREVLAEGRR